MTTQTEEPVNKKAKTTATTTMSNLQSLKYSNDDDSTPKLEVLDQLLVPHEKVYIPVPDVTTAYTVIQTMQIRGKR
jgi:methylthioribose-1-phosphate isomerase